MPLHPEVQQFLARQARAAAEAGIPPITEQTVEQARAGYRALAESLGPGELLASVEDLTCPGPGGDIPLRVYRSSGSRSAPALVYYHGGGWVIGDLETHDHLCRALAKRGECTVIAVDYRLAPEHPYPAAVEDAWAALHWIHHNATELGVDRSRLAVGGDSAGGNLAALMTLRARDEELPLVFQLLVYPAVDLRQQHPSIAENGEGYVLTRDHMVWFRDHYLSGTETPVELDDPQLSPLLAPRHDGLPPALIVTAEFDPLRDEGEDYAQVLRRAGVDVELRRFDGQVHIFFQLSPLLADGREAVDIAGVALREHLG